MQAHVGDWTRAGFLQPEQGAALAAELRAGFKRTNDLLRAALALFTLIIVAAAVGLVSAVLDIRDRWSIGILCLIAGGACAALAEYLVGALRLYRHGVEEALAAASVLLVAFGVAETLAAPYPVWWRAWSIAASIGALAVYWRFGFVYAAIGAMIFAALIPRNSSSRSLWSARWPRRCSARRSRPRARDICATATIFPATTTRRCKRRHSRARTSR